MPQKRNSKKKNKSGKKIKKIKIIVPILAVLVIAGGVSEVLLFGKEEQQNPWPEMKEPLRNPLTGKFVKELPTRPIILSTDNVAEARPQSGVSQADVLYEFPVEGMLTRLEPIYYTNIPKKIGPARSARPYFIDMAREYKAVFCHFGWSPAARRYLEKNIIPYISAFSYPEMYFRTSDHFPPHNAYISGKDIKAMMKEKGWDEPQDVRKFQFLGYGEIPTGDPAVNINVNYKYNLNNYKYNPDTGLYKRSVNGKPYIDKETGKQITTNNIIVQKVKSKVLDMKGRLKINMTKGGKAMLFTGGVVIEGTWERADLDSPTIFKGLNGEEFKLNTGTTWIQVVDQTAKVNYK